MPLILAFNPLAPIALGMYALLTQINAVTHNLALSLISLGVLIRLVFWPLASMQFKSMAKMQAMQPHLKAIQQKYQSDPARLQKETMELYRTNGTSPVAGCLPMVLQIPILIAVFQAITMKKAEFATTHFLWVGSTTLPHALQPYVAGSLANPDYLLLALYVISMFVSVRVSSPPATDPQQAQTQKIMAFVSPLMIAYFGLRAGWPSGLILFWLTSNVVQTIQSVLLLRGLKAQGDTNQFGNATPPTITIDSPRVATPTRDAASGPKRLHKGSRRSSR